MGQLTLLFQSISRHIVSRAKISPYQFKWLHLVVATFLLVSATAAWFVLTARSVFVEVNPITAQISIDNGTSIKLGQRYLIRTGSYQITLRNEGYHDTVTSPTRERRAITNPPVRNAKIARHSQF